MAACALCGTPAPPPFRAPPPEGAPDLDGRPGEPTRSTLPRWLQQCRGCGACAPDLSRLPAGVRPDPAIASPFLRWAALAQGTPDEGEALLQAAWAREDAGEDARDLRRAAAAAFPSPADEAAALRLADIQRRAGLLDEAATTLSRFAFSGQQAEIAAFERACIAAGDTGRHLLSSALRPPATKPHVAHVQRRPPAPFWRRWFG